MSELHEVFFLLMEAVNLSPPLLVSSTGEQHGPAGCDWCHRCYDWLVAEFVLSPVEHVLVPPQIVPGTQHSPAYSLLHHKPQKELCLFGFSLHCKQTGNVEV